MEFCNLIMSRGFPLSEIDAWNTGDLIDWAREHDRQLKRERGEDVRDPYEQYQQLKAMQPDIERMYAAGEIKEAKYKSYKDTLAQCERELKL